MSRRVPIGLSAVLVAATFAFSRMAAASDFQIRHAGNLTVPLATGLIAFSTDPTISQLVNQDVRTARRAPEPDAKSALTVTITVTQGLLKPGTSLTHLAAGDPQVADLIKQAGATPPPLGDTGNETDAVAVARVVAQRQLSAQGDSPINQVLNEFQGHGDLGPQVPCTEQENPQPGCIEPTPVPHPGNPDYRGDLSDYMHRRDRDQLFHHVDDAKSFQTVVVARASLTGSPNELTVVAVIQPGGDVVEAKKNVAEEIANAVLH